MPLSGERVRDPIQYHRFRRPCDGYAVSVGVCAHLVHVLQDVTSALRRHESADLQKIGAKPEPERGSPFKHDATATAQAPFLAVPENLPHSILNQHPNHSFRSTAFKRQAVLI